MESDQNKITLKETPETDEALRQLKAKKAKLVTGYALTYSLTGVALFCIFLYYIINNVFTLLP